MALNASRLATAIVAALKTLNPEITGVAETKLLDVWTKISTEIVNEVKQGTVTTNGTVTSGAGAGGSTSATGSMT